MSADVTIAVGQTWASNNGKRTVQILRYEKFWDDCVVRNLATGRKFAIYGVYLRQRYQPTEGGAS